MTKIILCECIDYTVSGSFPVHYYQCKLKVKIIIP